MMFSSRYVICLRCHVFTVSYVYGVICLRCHMFTVSYVYGVICLRCHMFKVSDGFIGLPHGNTCAVTFATFEQPNDDYVGSCGFVRMESQECSFTACSVISGTENALYN